MDATPEMQSKRAPYGIIGLCLSIVAAIVLTLIVMAAVAAAVYFGDAALHGMGDARDKSPGRSVDSADRRSIRRRAAGPWDILLRRSAGVNSTGRVLAGRAGLAKSRRLAGAALAYA